MIRGKCFGCIKCADDFIQGNELFSQTLLGLEAGDRISTLPEHGDRRDDSTSVTVVLRKVL